MVDFLVNMLLLNYIFDPCAKETLGESAVQSESDSEISNGMGCFYGWFVQEQKHVKDS